MRYALCSQSVPETALKALEDLGAEPILLPPHPALTDPVASHADMICAVLDKTVFFDKIYIETYPDVSRIISGAGYECACVSETLGARYPTDVILNVLIGDDFAAGHISSSEPLRGRLDECGKTFVPVKQGYAACSSLLARDRLVTADAGIASALSGFCKTLVIPSGGVDLAPYDTGFICGASGFDGERAYFVGDLLAHPAGKIIKEFLADAGIDTLSLTDGGLCDVGGIKFL